MKKKTSLLGREKKDVWLTQTERESNSQTERGRETEKDTDGLP